jgi:hypothetical protein
MSWPGVGPSGQFLTLNIAGGLASVNWEEARGDASGVIDNLIVIALQTRPVSPASPGLGQVLGWDGSTWGPVTPSGTVAGPHNFLSSVHQDTTTASPIEGDIITGSGAAPASWARFPIGQPNQSLSVSSSSGLVWRDPNIIPPVIITSGNYNVGINNERIVVVKTVGASTTIALPITPTFGQEVLIKDGKGDSGPPSNNFIDIIATSGTIDGFNTVRISQNYQGYSLMYNGTEWNII